MAEIRVDSFLSFLGNFVFFCVSFWTLDSGLCFVVLRFYPSSFPLAPRKLANTHPNTGRIELRTFLILYALTLPLQLLTTGAVFEQGSMALTVLTGIHAGASCSFLVSLISLFALRVSPPAPSLVHRLAREVGVPACPGGLDG